MFAAAGNLVLVFGSLAIGTAIFAAGVGDATAIRVSAFLGFAIFHFASFRSERLVQANRVQANRGDGSPMAAVTPTPNYLRPHV
jgi:hypothetical protein